MSGAAPRRLRAPSPPIAKREAARRADAARLLALCATCWGEGLVRTRAGVDACPVCAAAAEIDWRNRARCAPERRAG